MDNPTPFTLDAGAKALGMALLGGLVSWIMKVRAGNQQARSLTFLVGELCISCFAGLLCYLMCSNAGLSSNLTACMVGAAGHMGTRAIIEIEKWAAKKWGAITGDPK